MNIEQLKTNITAANNLVDATKKKLCKAIRTAVRDIDNGDGKRKPEPIEDINTDGIDFRLLSQDGKPFDASFQPDNAIDEDEYLIALSIDEKNGIVYVWSYDEDSSECDPIDITDDRLTMDDLLEVLKIIAIWNK